MIEVLISDRHALIRDCLRKIVSNAEGLAIAGEAAGMDDALDRLRSRRYDLVVAEIATGGRADFDGVGRLKSASPETPILILSAFSEERHAADALRAGASGYLEKECGGDVLVAVMRKVAGGGAFVSANVAEVMARRSQGADPGSHRLLSERERQIFAMINAGLRPGRIAGELGISVKTVSTHKTRILEKMGLANEAELIRYAVIHDLMPPDARPGETAATPMA